MRTKKTIKANTAASLANNPFKLMLTKNLVRAAVMHSIQCQCGNILDMRTATLMQGAGKSATICPDCSDHIDDDKRARFIELAETDPAGYTFVDARDLYRRQPTKRPPVAKSGYWYLQKHYSSWKAVLKVINESTLPTKEHVVFYLDRPLCAADR